MTAHRKGAVVGCDDDRLRHQLGAPGRREQDQRDGGEDGEHVVRDLLVLMSIVGDEDPAVHT